MDRHSRYLTSALQHQRNGRFDEAERIYRRILRDDGGNADALHLLGLVAQQVGDLRAAAKYIARAIEIRPSIAQYHCSLGNVLQRAGQHDQALLCYRSALSQKGDHADSHVNMGNSLQALGRHQEAIAHYLTAIETRPGCAEAYNNLGNAAVVLGRMEDGIGLIRHAIQLKPDYAEARMNLASALHACDLPDEAEPFCREAIRMNPLLAPAHAVLGTILFDQNARRHRMDYKSIEECFRESIRLSPSTGLTHYMHSLILLALGKFEEGWAKYEWRLCQRDSSRPAFSLPAWDGRALAGRTILVRAEQGLGDTIQFVRYAPLLKRQGARVIVECQPRLVPLLDGIEGADQVIAWDGERPPFDVYAFMMSLPYLCQTRAESIPGECPYVHADPTLVRAWEGKLGRKSGLRVGISWAGNPDHRADKRRSFAFSDIEPLLRIPGISWVSLQRGEPAWQLACSEFSGDVGQFEDETTTIADTAAMIANLDLVVSADTMVGHLSGALGKPTWLLLSAVPDWRWMLGRSDSPWYPTMRLFRQSSAGQWPAVISEVRDALVQEVRQ